MQMTQIECVVYGTVQGVGFRAYVQEAALSLGLVGYVRNEENGTVFVCAQGTPERLREFIEYLNEGPVTAAVDEVAVRWQSAQRQYDDFVIDWNTQRYEEKS